jgi:hypothetical protein
VSNAAGRFFYFFARNPLKSPDFEKEKKINEANLLTLINVLAHFICICLRRTRALVVEALGLGRPDARWTAKRNGAQRSRSSDGGSTTIETRSALLPLALSLHRCGGTGVSLLTIHAPIAEFIERDRLACHGAAHVGAWAENAKIAVEKFNFRFARVHRTPIEPVHFKDPDLVVL